MNFTSHTHKHTCTHQLKPFNWKKSHIFVLLDICAMCIFSALKSNFSIKYVLYIKCHFISAPLRIAKNVEIVKIRIAHFCAKKVQYDARYTIYYSCQMVKKESRRFFCSFGLFICRDRSHGSQSFFSFKSIVSGKKRKLVH